MYDVHKFAAYGKLSGKKLEDLRAGSRVEVDTAKRDPLDFVLWKSAKPGEPALAFTVGRGAPGLAHRMLGHVEKELGEHFDIHGGGLDLKFPHHENEIAQTCGATQARFAEIWMHNGFLSIDNEKMSKSLGNFFTAREVMAKIRHPEVLRFFLLSSQYRGPMNYSPDQLDAGRGHAERSVHRAARPAGAIDGCRPRRRPPSSSPRWTTTSIRRRRWRRCRSWRATSTARAIAERLRRPKRARRNCGSSEKVLGLFRAADWFHGADDGAGMSKAEIEQKLEQRKCGEGGERLCRGGSDSRRIGGRRHHHRRQARRRYLAPQIAAIGLHLAAQNQGRVDAGGKITDGNAIGLLAEAAMASAERFDAGLEFESVDHNGDAAVCPRQTDREPRAWKRLNHCARRGQYRLSPPAHDESHIDCRLRGREVERVRRPRCPRRGE